MDIQRFSAKSRERLGHYVYMYVDPRTDRPFYVGKGCGNRCFSHLKASDASEKSRTIRAIRKLGLKPRIEILKYGLSEPEALLVESTSIDIIGCPPLTNEIAGHGTRHGFRGAVADVAAALDAKPARITEPVVIINVSRSYHPAMGLQALYDATRCAWKMGKRRTKPKLALSVYGGVVREVFEIAEWLEAGQTMRACDTNGRPKHPVDRYEFVGRAAEAKVRRRYLGRSVVDYLKQGTQNPIRYVNC